MKCSNCNIKMGVADCRNSTEGKSVVRFRECFKCKAKIRTIEILEEDYQKLKTGNIVENFTDSLSSCLIEVKQKALEALAKIDEHTKKISAQYTKNLK